VAEHVERIAREVGLPIPDGFRFLSYVQGKCGVELRGNNVRDCIDQLLGSAKQRSPTSTLCIG